ncbi:S8 family serine peptidase [Candidatus Woesearchaeota archaeon]|jgi:hypothetical protein|nr:S8 family serine peptidase [Candidatus Woesearchaeota archaeon]MBT6518284.1 S8 family serine peptidase [Candidatus Woesearchaeota archaeon]MBT7367067.1 S8 family serine peptidase [Candidatus Woesearchaeota archaeon]
MTETTNKKLNFKKLNYIFIISVFCILILSIPVLAQTKTISKNKIDRANKLSTIENLKHNLINIKDVLNDVYFSKIFLKQIKANNKIHSSTIELINENYKKEKSEIKILIETKTKSFNHPDVISKQKIADRLFAATINLNEINSISKSKNIKIIYPNFEYHGEIGSALNAMNVNYMHDTLGVDGTGVKVAIIDSGIYAEHTMIDGHVILEKYFIESSPEDGNGHGTAIAGIVASTAPGAGIINVKVMNSNSQTNSGLMIQGINWVVDPDGNPNTDDGTDVISMSIGAKTYSTDQPLVNAIDNAINNGVVFVNSMGNCGPVPKSYCGGFQGVTFPGRYERLISVGATNNAKQWQGFSPGGDYGTYMKPDVVAPGKSINTADDDGTGAIYTGTSFAAPFVSATIALMLEQDPTLNHSEVKQLLEERALDLGTPGKDVNYGSGFVDMSLLNVTPTPDCFTDLECGANYTEDNLFCELENSPLIYDTKHTFTCVNPGTLTADCVESTESIVVETCEENHSCDSGTCALNQGCDYNNPSCDDDYNCINNQCILKEGCQYDNPVCLWFETCSNNDCVLEQNACYIDDNCDPNQECINNQCTLKQGCDYDNPTCEWFEICNNNKCELDNNMCHADDDCDLDKECTNNECTLKEGCEYNNPSCGNDYDCITNECILKEGCQYDNPVCLWFETCSNNDCILEQNTCYIDDNCDQTEECINNQCTLKQGCDYDNPTCEQNQDCINNQCILKTGCEYSNPECGDDFDCINNNCVLKNGCYYNNPNCDPDYNCIENECTLKSGCDYDNPSCENGEICFDNKCYLEGSELCGDGIDNDDDEYIDCHDIDCSPPLNKPFLKGEFCTLDPLQPTCCMDHNTKTTIYVDSFDFALCSGLGRYPVVNQDVCESMSNKYNYNYLGEIVP